jgi:hypothetical protein
MGWLGGHTDCVGFGQCHRMIREIELVLVECDRAFEGFPANLEARHGRHAVGSVSFTTDIPHDHIVARQGAPYRAL